MSSFYEDDENYCGDSNIIVSSSVALSSKDGLHGSSSSSLTTFKENTSSTMLSSSPSTLSIINVKPYSPSSQYEFICDHSTSHVSTEMNNSTEEVPTNSPDNIDLDHSEVIERLDLTIFRVTNDVTISNNESEINEADRRNSNTDEDSTVENNNHHDSTDTITAATVGVETTPERIAREERESQELVWELMRQDNQEVYSMQMQFMQENADHLSAEDFALIQALVNESAQQNNVLVASHDGADGSSNNDDDEQGEGNGDGGDEDNDGIDENDPNTWDYERLLALGQQMGDVKTERWRLRSRSVINQLKKLIYADILQCKMSGTTKEASIAETGAVVVAPLADYYEGVLTNKEHVIGSPTTNDHCRDEDVEEEHSSSNKKPCLRSEFDTPCDNPIQFNANTNATTTSLLDGNTTSTTTTTPSSSSTTTIPGSGAGCDISRGGVVVDDDVDRCVVCMEDFEPSDLLLQLPCRHYFHVPCTEGWVADNNCCPCCKKKITDSP